MGQWGAGNFDGDLPRDFLADMVGRWEKLVDTMLAGKSFACRIIQPWEDEA